MFSPVKRTIDCLKNALIVLCILLKYHGKMRHNTEEDVTVFMRFSIHVKTELSNELDQKLAKTPPNSSFLLLIEKLETPLTDISTRIN